MYALTITLFLFQKKNPIIKNKKKYIVTDESKWKTDTKMVQNLNPNTKNRRVWCKIGGPLRRHWPQHVLGALRQD